MSEENKKIIDEFVNSKDYFVIDYYISKPYIETIQEMEQEKQQLKSVLDEIRELMNRYNLGKYDYSIPTFEIQEILDKVKE